MIGRGEGESVAERSFGPVVVRRRLGSELRRLRERAGLSLEQVARELEASPSKISRLENGQSPAKLWDVRNLLTLYGVEDEGYRRRAERWVNEGKSEGYWHPYSDAVTADLDHYISLESEAEYVWAWSAQILHGLVQTESYSRVLLQVLFPGLDESTINGLVRVRMRRQEVLHREDSPLRMELIIDESMLRRKIGGSRVMREQLEHLRSLPPTVTLRVRSQEAPPHVAILSPFTIFYPRERDVDPAVVNVENAFHDAYWDAPAEVDRFERAFAELRKSALSTGESGVLINEIATGGEG